MVIQQQARSGPLLAVDKTDASSGQVREFAHRGLERRRGQKSQLAVEQVYDRHVAPLEIPREKRNVVFAALRIEQVAPGDVGRAVRQEAQSLARTGRGREDVETLALVLHRAEQDVEYRIVAPGGQKRPLRPGAHAVLFPYPFERVRADPLVDELPWEHPLAGDPGARYPAVFDERVDLLFVYTQVLRDLFCVHHLTRHGSASLADHRLMLSR